MDPDSPVSNTDISQAPVAPTGVNSAPSTGGLNGPFPAELRGWNWGAFLLNWIWGIGNSVWIALLSFLPFIGLIMLFVLGAKGNEWAWQNRKFDNVEEFKAVQRAWTRWGVGLFLLQVVGIVASLIILIKTNSG